mgnify:CR=1 FL=1
MPKEQSEIKRIKRQESLVSQNLYERERPQTQTTVTRAKIVGKPPQTGSQADALFLERVNPKTASKNTDEASPITQICFRKDF